MTHRSDLAVPRRAQRIAAWLAAALLLSPLSLRAQDESQDLPDLDLDAEGEILPPEDEQPKPPPRLSNSVAEFTGIDKITGRIISFDVYVDETVQFGALQVTPRICYSRPSAEVPKTDSFVEVDEITLDRKIRRIFTGWMFAESPGLNAVEHPVYDVWLKGCKDSSKVPAPEETKAE